MATKAYISKSVYLGDERDYNTSHYASKDAEDGILVEKTFPDCHTLQSTLFSMYDKLHVIYSGEIYSARMVKVGSLLEGSLPGTDTDSILRCNTVS